jgi:hypothetical protein
VILPPDGDAAWGALDTIGLQRDLQVREEPNESRAQAVAGRDIRGLRVIRSFAHLSLRGVLAPSPKGDRWMGRRLRREEVTTIQVLHERGLSTRAIARQLGVRENAVRYRLRRLAEDAPDGGAGKPFRAEALAGAIGRWREAAQA